MFMLFINVCVYMRALTKQIQIGLKWKGMEWNGMECKVFDVYKDTSHIKVSSGFNWQYKDSWKQMIPLTEANECGKQGKIFSSSYISFCDVDNVNVGKFMNKTLLFSGIQRKHNGCACVCIYCK